MEQTRIPGERGHTCISTPPRTEDGEAAEARRQGGRTSAELEIFDAARPRREGSTAAGGGSDRRTARAIAAGFSAGGGPSRPRRETLGPRHLACGLRPKC
jgi:hypothetical protein